MKRYTILRNNRESGPFSLRDLRSFPLFSTDLVWIEEESTCWKHPLEFDELKDFIQTEEKNPQVDRQAGAHNAPKKAAGTAVAAAQPSEVIGDGQPPLGAASKKPSFEELVQKYEREMPSRNAPGLPAAIGAGLFGSVIFLVGAAMIVVVVRNAVADLESHRPLLATAEAKEIGSLQLPVSRISHQALGPTTPQALLVKDTTSVRPALAVANLSHAAATVSVVPAPLAGKQASLRLPDTLVKANKNADSANFVMTEAQSGLTVEKNRVTRQSEATANPVETRLETPADKNLLQVSVGDYKVGLFGGISNLTLTVKNSTGNDIEKAIVAIEYLKPNGKVVHTQTVDVSGLAVGTSKTIEVPNSSRGVSIRYHVQNR